MGEVREGGGGVGGTRAGGGESRRSDARLGVRGACVHGIDVPCEHVCWKLRERGIEHFDGLGGWECCHEAIRRGNHICEVKFRGRGI